MALRRYGVPSNIVNLISSKYASQLFTVKAAGKNSETLEAKSGIRQSCPLSSYLFLILHSMVLHDVDKQLLEHGGLMPWVLSQQTPFYNLAYADDRGKSHAQPREPNSYSQWWRRWPHTVISSFTGRSPCCSNHRPRRTTYTTCTETR